MLIRILAAGINKTETNTRLGWYSSSVTGSAGDLSDSQKQDAEHKADGGWNEATHFPIIQGTDCCGRVVALGGDYDAGANLLGRRVLIRACMPPLGFGSMENVWMASDVNGAFAEFVTVPISEIFAVNCDWSDAELATVPCAYATAETILRRAGCVASDHVFVTGASGDVGSAVIQLAKCRGASVTALTSRSKLDTERGLGADRVVTYDQDLIAVLGEGAFDLVIDNVAGAGFPVLLRRGGRFASSGMIAGPVVSLDLRDMCLEDIRIFGTTVWDEPFFANLICYIEAGGIRLVLAASWSLADIVAAHIELVRHAHVGNVVLIPPPL